MAYAGKAGSPRRLQAGPNSPPANDSRPVGSLVTGLVIGALVGATVALLFAPERGIDTRRRMGRSARRAGLRGRDAWEDLRLELLRARRKLKRARRRAETALEEQAPEVVEG
jgi:gas vesicle protein